MRRRLVQQEQRRILRDERREREAPPFAAGERSRIAPVEAGESEGRQRRARPLDIGGRFPLPAREMRMPTDERGLEHGGGEVVDAVLRQETADPRALARAECGERLAVVSDLARSRVPEARRGR